MLAALILPAIVGTIVLICPLVYRSYHLDRLRATIPTMQATLPPRPAVNPPNWQVDKKLERLLREYGKDVSDKSGFPYGTTEPATEKEGQSVQRPPR